MMFFECGRIIALWELDGALEMVLWLPKDGNADIIARVCHLGSLPGSSSHEA